MKMNWKTKGIVVALTVHAIVCALVVYPVVAIQSEGAIGFVVVSTVLYFPVSLLAWAIVSGTESTVAFAGTFLIAGGVWYCLLGFWIGRQVDRERNE